MYNGYKIVVNTAAGRRRYMKYLMSYVLSSDIVDRYDLWINTHNVADIEFFKRLADKFHKINLVWQPDMIVNGNKSINAFYRQCVDEETIYFKLDDDIVWMEPDLIEKMVKFRIDNPSYFLVSPLVINNSISSYILQVHGKLPLVKYYNASASHKILWRSGSFALELHRWFIDNFLKSRKYQSLYTGKQEMGITRFSINSILWFGCDMKKFDGIVDGDDEEFLSCIYPSKNNLTNCWNGDALLSHFAFFTQRYELDKSDILFQYGKHIEDGLDGALIKNVFETIKIVLNTIDSDINEIMKQSSPYKKVVTLKTRRKKIKNDLKSYISYLSMFFKPKKIYILDNLIDKKRDIL